MPADAPRDLVLGESNRNLDAAGVTFDYPNVEKVDILVTFRCNAACAHCITRSHPKRTEWLTDAEVRAVLDAGVAAGKTYVSFSGGEPFLNLRFILGCIEYAKELGYYVAADTNAFWGTSSQRAQSWARQIRNAGLDAIYPSGDGYHEPFIPIDSVRRVVEACEDVGLVTEINFYPTPDADQNERIIADLDLNRRGYYCDGLLLTGNDVSPFLDAFPELEPREIDDYGSMHLAVTPLGGVYANVDVSDTAQEFAGTPLDLGNIRQEDPGTVLAREQQRPVLAVARVKGPREVDEHLRADPGVCDAYAASFDGRRFYSPTAYWLALFADDRSDRIVASLDAWGTELGERR